MNAAIKITVTSLIVVLFAFSLFFVGIRAMGLATFVVTGGSMEPTIHKGSLVIDEPVSADKLRLGDIITFDHFDQTTTHRIVGVEGSANGSMFSTKGDANQITDPEPLSFPGRVGLVKLAIPGVGFAVAWMQYVWRLGATLVAAVIFFSCAAMVFLRKDKPAVAAAAPVQQAAKPIKISKLSKAAKTAKTRKVTQLAPVAPAISTEVQRMWNEHERWLQQAHTARMRAA